MTLKDEFAVLTERIAKARAELAAWRGAGMQEKYLEAYSLVDALELQLERLRQAGLAVNEEALPMRAPAAVTREQLMTEFSISHDGRQYQYARYRYDLLTDAIDYAKLQRSTLSGSDGDDPMPPMQDVAAPDESQRKLMAELAITFQDGIYRLGEYRYNRLADAVNYARLQRLHGPRP
jgi:hypothetical protein